MQKEILDLIKKADPKKLAAVEAVIKEYCAEKANTLQGAAQNPANQQMSAADGPTNMGPSERAIAALKAAARILTPFKEELGGELLQKVLAAAGMHSPKEPGTISQGGDVAKADKVKKGATQSPEPIKEEHMVEAMKAADEAMKASLKKLGYEKYPEGKLQMKSLEMETDGDEDEEVEMSGVEKSDKGDSKVKQEVLKADGSLNLEAVPEALRPTLEHVFKTQQELVKKNADLTKELADRQAAEEKREIVAKADSLTHLGLPKEDVVATLTDAKKMGTEAYIRITKGYEALNEQNKASKLFTEIGSGLSDNGAEMPWEQIEKAAAGYVAKSETKCSAAEGVSKFLETAEGQRMYGQYKASRKGGI